MARVDYNDGWQGLEDVVKDNPVAATRIAMREMLARRNANMIFGNGISFESEDEGLNKKYQEINRKAKFNELFHWIERELSSKGSALITMNKTNDGEIRLNIGDRRYFNGVAKVFYVDELAVVYQKFVLDNKNYVSRCVYSKEKVEYDFFTDDTTKGEAMILGSTVEIEKKLGIEKVWRHNLGFVPIIQMFNLPLRQMFFDVFEYIKLADWYPAQEFEEIACDVIINLRKELAFNHSRIGIENASQEVIKELKKSNVSNTIHDFGDYIIETDTGAKMTPVPGVSAIDQYTKVLEEIHNFYFRYCGSSPLGMTGGAQKTSAETSMTSATSQETITMKMNLRKDSIKELLAKMFAFYKLLDYNGDWNFDINIPGNIQKDETTYIDNLIKLISQNIISIPEAIAEVKALSYKDALANFDIIKKFNDENEIMTAIQAPEMEDMEFGGDEGGAPEKKLEKGNKANE